MSRESQQKEQSPQMNLPGMGGRGPRGPQTIEKPKEAKVTLKKLISYMGNEKILVLSLVSVVVFVVLCSIYAPRLQSNAIDSISERNFLTLPRTLVFMLILYLIQELGQLVQTLLGAILSQRIIKKMREDLFDKIVHLPIKYLDTHPHGDIMSRMTNDVENISNTVSQSLSSLVSGVLTIIGTVGMMLYLCWQLALLSCTTVLLTLLATKYLSAAMRKFFRKRQVLLGEINSTVEEMVTGYKTVVAYNRQDDIKKQFAKTSDELTKTGIVAESLGGSMGPVMNTINNIGFVIIAAFGGYFAYKGMISIGVISAFIFYAKQFGHPINQIAQLWGQIQTAIAGAERIFDIMDEASEDKSGQVSMGDTKGVITFRNVDFSYVEGKKVLHDFNLEVKAGQKIALVGATGSGKTTVVNLLMKFYDIDSGEILIDGLNIKDISSDELRRNTAIVLQDTVLFSDTIESNLKYSNEEATSSQLEEAMKTSNTYKMIRRMPKGLQTILSRSGSNLSQGQRQLLSICRACLANPKILILDEATSSVDTRTEKSIQDAMAKLMKERTSLIIAHRLSTIQDADRIVVMDQGRIVEIGNHNELLFQKGRYYELYMTQFAGNAI